MALPAKTFINQSTFSYALPRPAEPDAKEGRSDELPSPTNFTGKIPTQFQLSRETGRRVAALTTEEEYNELISRHQSFVVKKFSNQLTGSEALEWNLVRWRLDQIEDARHGAELDILEFMADQRKHYADELSKFVEIIRQSTLSRSRKERY